MPSELVTACTHQLIKRQLSVAFIESATAGRLCSEFALVPNSGQVLKGGIICYDACVKEDLLKVPSELIERFTPESAEVTKQLAINARSLFPADIHVAITGLTTEGGSESREKPVGTMFIHILIGKKSIAAQSVFKGTAEKIVMQTIDRVASLLLERLEEQHVANPSLQSN
jgi:nicotinamide-nucleotide amidase